MALAQIHAIHRIHEDKSAQGTVGDVNENMCGSANGHSAVLAEFYTLLLKDASYFVDAATRERVLDARRLGGLDVSFRPAIDYGSCECHRAVTIASRDVLGFIAHDQDSAELAGGNVIPLRAIH